MELSNFVSSGSSYQAERGTTDDIVMTLVMLAWYTSTENFEYLSTINIDDLYREKYTEVDDIIAPIMTTEEPAGYYEAGDYWVKP
jgi:ABC-type transport system involved in cytochrome bd biosynthesis fused ATPase/permease subunit